MRFHVQGTDAQTGQPVSTFIEAVDREAAAAMATEQGIVIESISDRPLTVNQNSLTVNHQSINAENVFTESLRNTWSAWKILVKNPIDGIAIASEALGDRGMLQAGLVSGIFYILSQIFLFNRVIPIVTNFVSSLLTFGVSNFSVSDYLGFDFYIKTAIVAAVPLASLTLGLFIARKITRTPDNINTDIFGAGISFLPVTLVYTIIAILTPGSWEFVFILFLWSLCLLVLMSYHCFTVLTKLPSRLAVYAVPLTVIVNTIISKIVGDILF